MRIVFFGTPEFAVPSLQRLLSSPDLQVQAVFTQPDRPRGRGNEVSASPVKRAALEAGLNVHQPEKIRAPQAEALLRSLAPEAIVIIGYGQIIPVRLLDIPTHGWINLHASLLPKYRGAAPIQWAIASGGSETGVTTMRIDAGMDTGAILLQEAAAIGPTETAPELGKRLAERGALLLTETLRRLSAGDLTPRPQNEAEASYARILTKEDGRIDWMLSATEIYNRMRGFHPWPGAFTTFRGTIHQLKGEPVSDEPARGEPVTAEPASAIAEPGPPGTIFTRGRELFVVCGRTTALRIRTVKAEGRKEVTAAEFANGARLQPRERFGES